ncbi:hypothetical protein V8V73_25320, partial [Priestia megaterium]|uniref:hypothetical protein n=1 Tax=Priestia megaterium TaxID=1404 RepID=UPI003009F27D
MDKVDNYKNRLVILCDELQTLYRQLESKIDIQSKEEEKIKDEVCKNLVHTLHNLVSTALNSNDNLITLVSTLRYTLESLIVTKLCLKEPDYIYKMYFQTEMIHNSRLNSMISRIQNEIKLLDELDLEEQRLTIKYGKELVKKIKKLEDTYKDDADLLGGKVRKASSELKEKIFSEMNQKAYEHISLFFEDVENNGFDFQKDLIKNQLLSPYEEELRKSEKKLEEIARNLANSDYFSELFNLSGQPEKVWEALEDKKRGRYRTWQQKASTVNLGDEYTSIYELTSKLLHCVSYSIFTSKFLAEEELLLIYRQLFQYIKKIIKCIHELSLSNT